jgi:hypothetical protein
MHDLEYDLVYEFFGTLEQRSGRACLEGLTRPQNRHMKIKDHALGVAKSDHEYVVGRASYASWRCRPEAR